MNRYFEHIYDYFNPPEFIDSDDIRQSIRPFLKYVSRKKVEPREMALLLYRYISKFNVGDVEVKYSKIVERGDINIQAEYEDAIDEDGEEPIFLTLIFREYMPMKVSSQYVQDIENRIVDALEHEMVHMYQARARDFEMQRDFLGENEDQSYLGNPDEIGAFAVNIASELTCSVFGDKVEAKEIFRYVTKTARTKQKGRYISPNLYGYMDAWHWDVNHPIIKKLLKKVYKQLDQM